MSDEMVETVLRFIEKKVQSPELKQLNLSFFGGEPLLYYTRKVLPLLKKISSLCNERQVKLQLSFTTNGYLLTQKLLESLKELEAVVSVSFQITIDGNEELHNKQNS